MEHKSKKLLDSLREYYSIKNRFYRIQSIINADPNSNNVSLRLVDWLITNYSKSKNIVYYVKGSPFNVHQSYKNMLKAYSKRLFDPFRRHGRIVLEHEGNQLETTVAQLSFFRWAIENDILKYASENRDSIKKNMDFHTKNRSKDKRCELSKTTKGANMYSVNICVSFS
jgi:hypothetical protein